MFNLSTSGEEYKDDATEIRTLRCRIQMAQAYSSLTSKAFAALMNYGINYHALPEYQDTALLDEGSALNLVAGQEKFMEWMRRVEHGIEAAIRRKQFKLHQVNPKGLN